MQHSQHSGLWADRWGESRGAGFGTRLWCGWTRCGLGNTRASVERSWCFSLPEITKEFKQKQLRTDLIFKLYKVKCKFPRRLSVYRTKKSAECAMQMLTILAKFWSFRLSEVLRIPMRFSGSCRQKWGSHTRQTTDMWRISHWKGIVTCPSHWGLSVGRQYLTSVIYHGC